MSTEDQVVTPPMPAPAAAPVPAPTPAPADAPAPDADAVTPYEYAEIPDDPGLTMALKFVGKLGLTPESPELKAAMEGDFNFIKAKLASMGAKAQGFEHYIALAEKSFANHVTAHSAKVAAAETAIHAAVGGPEQWQAIQSWASANADDGEKEQINAMLNAGGFQARAAAALLHSMHSNAVGTVVNPANAAPGAASSGAPVSGSPLTAAEYANEVSKLVRQYGARGAQSAPEMKVLDQRRANSRN